MIEMHGDCMVFLSLLKEHSGIPFKVRRKRSWLVVEMSPSFLFELQYHPRVDPLAAAGFEGLEQLDARARLARA